MLSEEVVIMKTHRTISTPEHEHTHCSCCCNTDTEHKHEHANEHKHEEKHHHSHSCSCCEHTEHERKTILIRIALGIVMFATGLVLSNNLYLLLVAYIILGYDVIINGIKEIFTMHVLSEHFLMSIASLGAFFLGEYADGCAVMLLYQIGEYLCDAASEKSEKSIRELIDIKPEYANLITENGIEKIAPESLETDNVVAVSTGEKVPSDGIVIEGKTQLDTSSMTGEAEYSYVTPGSEVISGTVNCGSLIKVKITKPYSESGVSKVTRLLEEIENNKSKSEKFITVFAKYYTPIVIILALFTFLFPTLFFNADYSVWGYRALVFLVVSCPCALVISVPLAFYSANGCASRLGILIKGSVATEKLSKIKTIAFDKTGTLTKGAFRLEGIRCIGMKAEVLEMLAYAEYYSTHPLSEALINEYKRTFAKEIDAGRISDYTEIGGKGISVKIDNKQVLVGNEKLMVDFNIDFSPAQSRFTIVYIAVDNKLLGYAEFTDGIKPEAAKAISDLKKMGISTMLLSGDKKNTVNAVASALGIENFHYELLPNDKVEIVDEYKKYGNTAFVGDGINDAPVIACSDVGISMGLNGSDAAIEASDLVILSDDISKIPSAIKLSKKTMRIVFENIVFSIAIKLLIMILGSFGTAGLWLAVFGDVGVSILAVLNSLRAMRYNFEEQL